MKRFLLFLLLFINLQIVVQYNGLSLCSLTKVYAQHQTREAGDNCYDMEIGWYHSPFSDCSDIHVDRYLCQYCHTGFDTELARLQHEKNCPDKPQPYNCSYCNQGFDNLAECQIHEESPCPQRYKCSKCGNSFNSLEELSSHNCGSSGTGGNGGCSPGNGGSGVGGSGSSSSSGTGSSSGRNLSTFHKDKLRNAAKEVFDSLNQAFPTITICNIGVQEMSKKLFGKILDELKGNANTIHDNLEKSSRWHKINYTQANEYANKGKFVIASWKHPNGGSGHVDTVLPGHTGTTWKDIYVMDTGYAPWSNSFGQSGNSRSEEQNIKNSFGEKKRNGTTGSFGIYYYE